MKRSKFNLSYYNLMSGFMGHIIPCGLTEVLPGDTFLHSTSALVRMAPMVTPVMHPVHVKFHHWFVPHRLVWEDFEDFITGGEDGTDASILPYIDVPSENPISKTMLAHWLGVPLGLHGNINALPLRGYNLIFNEWYRDQDLTTELPIGLASGADSTTTGWDSLPQSAAWSKDMFNTARPYAQKGPGIRVPMNADAGQVRNPVSDDGSTISVLRESGDTPYALHASNPYLQMSTTISGNDPLYVDTSELGGLISELRVAGALQRFEEARQRYGSRFTEYLRYLGVRPSDQRLQRPEYLGGGKQTLQISEVLQTGEGENPVGTLRGHGIGSARSNKYVRFFEEHGYVHTFMTVMPIPIYGEGCDKHWFKQTKYDFFQKELQQVGQQEVLRKEVYGSGDQGDTVFGYQDRYYDYMQGRHRVTGDFADSAANDWHFARMFGEPPTLNNAFVRGTPPNRPFADQSGMELMVMLRQNIRARRLVGSGVESIIK